MLYNVRGIKWETKCNITGNVSFRVSKPRIYLGSLASLFTSASVLLTKIIPIPLGN